MNNINRNSNIYDNHNNFNNNNNNNNNNNDNNINNNYNKLGQWLDSTYHYLRQQEQQEQQNQQQHQQQHHQQQQQQHQLNNIRHNEFEQQQQFLHYHQQQLQQQQHHDAYVVAHRLFDPLAGQKSLTTSSTIEWMAGSGSAESRQHAMQAAINTFTSFSSLQQTRPFTEDLSNLAKNITLTVQYDDNEYSNMTEDAIPSLTLLLITIFYGLVVFGGVLSNATLMLTLCSSASSRLRNPLLLAVCIADLLVTGLSAPVTLFNLAMNRKTKALPLMLCKIIHYIQVWPVAASTMSFFMLSLDRYATVKHPRLAQLRQNRYLHLTCALLSWLMSAAISTPFLFAYKIIVKSVAVGPGAGSSLPLSGRRSSNHHENHENTGHINISSCTADDGTNTMFVSFIIFHTIAVFIIPGLGVLLNHYGVRQKLCALSLTARAAHGELPLPMPILRRRTHVVIVTGMPNAQHAQEESSNVSDRSDSRSDESKRECAADVNNDPTENNNADNDNEDSHNDEEKEKHKENIPETVKETPKNRKEMDANNGIETQSGGSENNGGRSGDKDATPGDIPLQNLAAKRMSAANVNRLLPKPTNPISPRAMREIRAYSQRQRINGGGNHRPGGNNNNGNNPTGWVSIPLPQTSTLRSRRRLANMLIASALIFIACWAPHVFCVLYKNLGYKQYCSTTSTYLNLLLGYTYSAISPVIYWALNHNTLRQSPCAPIIRLRSMQNFLRTRFRSNTVPPPPSSTNEAALGAFNPKLIKLTPKQYRAQASSHYLY